MEKFEYVKIERATVIFLYRAAYLYILSFLELSTYPHLLVAM